MPRLIDQLLNRPAPPPEQVAARAGAVQLVTMFDDTRAGLEHSFEVFARDGFAGSGPVFAVVATRMRTLSEAMFILRDRTTKEPVPSGDRLRLLETPWPNGTTGDLIARIDLDVSLAGNSYWHNTGRRLQRLRPDWVKLVLTPDRTDLLGYTYQPGGTGKATVLPPEEVAHVAPVPDPLHPYRGMSWMQPVTREIDADILMQTHTGKFFQNGAVPLTVLKHERVLEPEAREQLRAQFDRRYGGTDNAYKTLVVEGGADLQVIGADHEKMTFEKLASLGEARIASAAGVPPIVVAFTKGLDAATYSNYGQAMRAYADTLCRPLWRNIAGSLARIINVPADKELWYNDQDIAFLKQDAKDQADINGKRVTQIATLTNAGYTPETAVAAVTSGDFTKLAHVGLFSVQLQPPNLTVDLPDPPEEET